MIGDKEPVIYIVIAMSALLLSLIFGLAGKRKVANFFFLISIIFGGILILPFILELWIPGASEYIFE